MRPSILAELEARIGVTGFSDWLLVDQSMIDRFADATLDHQFIHVDPERAACTPFGGTVAHGFLTLSLLSHFAASLPRPTIAGVKMGVNYGLDRVRFVHPVRSGSRIRAAATLLAAQEKRPGQFSQTIEFVIEIEGIEKPALTAVWLTQFFV